MICSYCLQASKQSFLWWWFTEVESRTQGSRQRSRTQKNPRPRPKPRTTHPRTDFFEAKDRNAKDQWHKRKCSPKKKSSKIFFGRSQKKVFKIFFQAFSSKIRHSKIFFQAIYKISTIQKKCCPRAEDRPIFEGLRPRGQCQRLDLRGQGQGLQNYILEDSTSDGLPLLVGPPWQKFYAL